MVWPGLMSGSKEISFSGKVSTLKYKSLAKLSGIITRRTNVNIFSLILLQEKTNSTKSTSWNSFKPIKNTCLIVCPRNPPFWLTYGIPFSPYSQHSWYATLSLILATVHLFFSKDIQDWFSHALQHQNNLRHPISNTSKENVTRPGNAVGYYLKKMVRYWRHFYMTQ